MANIDIKPYYVSTASIDVDPNKEVIYVSITGTPSYPTFGVASYVAPPLPDVYYLRSTAEETTSDCYIGKYEHNKLLFNTEVLLPFKGYLHSMAIDPYGRIVILAHDGKLYYTTDYNMSGFVEHPTAFAFGTTGVARIKWAASIGFYFNVGTYIYYSTDGVTWNTRPGPGAGKTGPVVVDTIEENPSLWYFDNQTSGTNYVWKAAVYPITSTFAQLTATVTRSVDISYYPTLDTFFSVPYVESTGLANCSHGHPERTWYVLSIRKHAKGTALINASYYTPYYNGANADNGMQIITQTNGYSLQGKTTRQWRSICNIGSEIYFAGGVGYVLVNTANDTVNTYYTVTGVVGEVQYVPTGEDPTVRSTYSYPTFSAQAIAENPIVGSGIFSYPTFLAAITVNAPIAVFSEIGYQVYTATGVIGAFPKEYPVYEWKVTSVIASMGSVDMAIADPTTPYYFGDLVFPKYAVDYHVSVVTEGTGDWVYPTFEILGGTNPTIEDIELLYPIFSVVADVVNANLVRNANRYPAFSSQVSVNVTIPSDIEVLYPEFSMRGRITSNTVKGDLIFAAYSASAIVVPFEVFADLQYASYGIVGEAQQMYAVGDFVYPGFTFDGETGNTRGVYIEATYANFEADIEVYQPVWLVGDNAYPIYGIEGELNVPIGVMADTVYAGYRVDGLGGLFVAVKDSNPTYPVFRITGRTGFTTSVDAAIIYPRYRIAADLGRNPKGEIIASYPKFSVAYEMENYYGMNMDVVENVTVEIDADRLKSRRNLSITEV